MPTKKSLKLSVIVPVYNEVTTVTRVIKKLLKHRQVGQVVVVNDGSTDGTKRKLQTLKHRKLTVLHKGNGGKGSAIRFGLPKIKGSYVLIQDADLEYDPDDIQFLLDPIKKGKATVVYGSRFLGPHSNLLYWHRKGNDFLNFMVNILFNTTLSDMETCYKLVPTKLLKQLTLTAYKFEIEPEITCQILKRGHNIYEVPISYTGRDFSQGKKISWRDGWDALWMILKERFTP